MQKPIHTTIDPSSPIYNYTVFNDHNIGNVKKNSPQFQEISARYRFSIFEYFYPKHHPEKQIT